VSVSYLANTHSRAQGAAMAFEDAAVLGVFFSKLKSKDQICDLVRLYDETRRPRAMECRDKSRNLRHVFTSPNGPEQAERDRRLRERKPYEGSPNFLSDPSLAPWLFEYDAVQVGEEAWKNYLLTSV
jgi:salicylate hydroxylase